MRAPELRQTRSNETACAEFGAWHGVVLVEGNPKTGSILLCYDVSRIQQQDMEARVAERLAVLLGGVPAEEEPELAVPQGGQTLWQMNRYAKIGMLGSLTGTLLALAVGKRLHAAFGGLHLAFLTVHLANHRNKLLK